MGIGDGDWAQSPIPNPQSDAGGEISQNMDTSGKNSEKLYDDAIEDNGERNQDQQKFAKEEDLPVIRVRG